MMRKEEVFQWWAHCSKCGKQEDAGISHTPRLPEGWESKEIVVRPGYGGSYTIEFCKNCLGCETTTDTSDATIETIGQLHEALSEYGPDDKIGVAMSSITGWVQGIKRITKDDKGRVIIDLIEETLDTEEANIE